MQISYKHQTTEIKNSNTCIVTKHAINDELIDFAIVNVTGRYPETQYAINRTFKEIVYIHAGNGKVTINGKEHLIGAGDLVLIEAGEKFAWEGKLDLFISCSPAFIIEQHHIVA